MQEGIQMKPTRVEIRYLIVFALVGCTAVGFSAHASQAPAAEFDPLYNFGATTMMPVGTGTLKYLGFISIYDGTLYLPPSVAPRKALDDVPKRLEVVYLRAFSKKDIGLAAIAGIKKNVSAETYARLKGRIARHNALYTDIEPGDRVALTYMPSVGTRVEINNVSEGIVEGADFARALFSIWLGDFPFDKRFKQALLGGSR
jgi:hypothetical protein